jgi:predicted dithiol-disulfide oxidoreductase (DUF899 family)
MKLPQVVSEDEWEAARDALLVKEYQWWRYHDEYGGAET